MANNVLGKAFRAVFTRRRTQAAANAKAMLGQAAVVAETDSDVVALPQTLDDIKKQYDRTDLRQNYRQTIEDPKNTTINLAMASKLQSDALSAAQRDHVMQVSSRIRSTFHAAARRASLGSDDGPIAKGVVGEVERMLKR